MAETFPQAERLREAQPRPKPRKGKSIPADLAALIVALAKAQARLDHGAHDDGAR